jgi:DNA (cytosine-5)-methyltransferase 1
VSYYVEDHENGPLRANGAGGPPRTDKQPLLAHALTSEGRDASEDGTGRGTPLVTAFHQTQEPITGDDFSPAIGRTSLGMGVGQGTGVRRLTPRECERLQALPDDWTNHGPDSRRYAALGDAVTSSVAEWIGHRIIAA